MFKIQARLDGFNRLRGELARRQKASRQKDNGTCTVGYSAPYAVFVHENLEANHPHGQAKFLEQPARAMKNELGASVKADAHNGIGLAVATEKAAVKLLEASQELVPVATGVLKASGFVRDAKGNLIAGSDVTADEAQAWRTLLEKQERERARQAKRESEAE